MATQKLSFTKMHGIGNDYVYVNCLEHELRQPSEVSKKISDRHFGIGSDGLVLILPSKSADFRMRMFNADGSEAQMCGNAVRCIAKYLFDRGITKNRTIRLETNSGVKLLELDVRNGAVAAVTVDMGEPILEPMRIPARFPGAKIVAQRVPDGPPSLLVTCVSMGNPHAVFFVPEITDALVLETGPSIERHSAFPERINVEFAQVKNRREVSMRVWERGSGETLACGTGACAVCVAGVLNDVTERAVTVHLMGGDLAIEWAADNHVYKTGPATFVFDGEVEL